jgi:hypothetical protein
MVGATCIFPNSFEVTVDVMVLVSVADTDVLAELEADVVPVDESLID